MKPFPHSPVQPFNLIDTHSHIDMDDFQDLDSVIENAKQAGVEKIILPSVDRSSFQKVIEICKKYENVYGALGIHPTEAQGVHEEDFGKILELLKAPAPIEVGDKCNSDLPNLSSPLAGGGKCGLDFSSNSSPLAEQREPSRDEMCDPVGAAKRVREDEFQHEFTSVRNSGEGYISNKIVAIGECGLDYYWDKAYVEKQKEVFLKQIEIAKKTKKALIVHDREAHKDTFDLLTQNIKDEIPVVMHCFSGSLEFAKECIKKGFYIALGGVVTFKNAKKAHEIAKEIPLEFLLLETDAPYLTPVPFRGKRNEPAYVKFVAKEIAKLRGISFKEVAHATTQNAKKVFGI